MKVFIRHVDFNRTTELYFIEDSYPGEKHLRVKPLHLELVPFNPGDEIEPTLRLTGEISDSFLQALADALDKEGVKTDKDAKIVGTLEATRYHLEDMRRLLKLRKEP